MITDPIITKQREILAKLPRAIETRKTMEARALANKRMSMEDEDRIVAKRKSLHQSIEGLKLNLEKALTRVGEVDIGRFAVFAENETVTLLDRLEALAKKAGIAGSLTEEEISNLKTIIHKTGGAVNLCVEAVQREEKAQKIRIESIKEQIEVLAGKKSGVALFLKTIPLLLMAGSVLAMVVTDAPLVRKFGVFLYPDSKLLYVYLFGCLFVFFGLIDYFTGRGR